MQKTTVKEKVSINNEGDRIRFFIGSAQVFFKIFQLSNFIFTVSWFTKGLHIHKSISPDTQYPYLK